MARYEWTTAKGAQVVIDIEKVERTETAYADGWNVELKKSEKRIARMTVDGAEVEQPRFWAGDQAKFRLDGREGAAIVPEALLAQIWAEERAALAAETAAEDKREAEHKQILDVMRE